jgi:hypothetical protein
VSVDHFSHRPAGSLHRAPGRGRRPALSAPGRAR